MRMSAPPASRLRRGRTPGSSRAACRRWMQRGRATRDWSIDSHSHADTDSLGIRQRVAADGRRRSSESGPNIPELMGKPCPAWVFANDQDYAYGRFLLDESSLQYVTAHIDATEEPFRRALVWGALWDGVRELRMAPSAYIRLAIRTLSLESEEALTQSVLGHAATAFQRYLSDAQRAATTPTAIAHLKSILAGASRRAGPGDQASGPLEHDRRVDRARRSRRTRYPGCRGDTRHLGRRPQVRVCDEGRPSRAGHEGPILQGLLEKRRAPGRLD